MEAQISQYTEKMKEVLPYNQNKYFKVFLKKLFHSTDLV